MYFLKAKMCPHHLNSANNGLLLKGHVTTLKLFLSFLAMVGKDTNGLKLEKR